MDELWMSFTSCLGGNLICESEDRRSRRVFSSFGSKVINESPKVTISNTLLKEQNYYESDVFAGSLNGRAVAIRVVNKEYTSEAIEESKILSKLEHSDGVIKFYFKFEDVDQIYIVTEYYKTSLEDYLQLSEAKKDLSAKEICLQLTQAVEFLHEQNIPYLNLNPENIHIVGSNGVQKVKLTNFSNRSDIPLIEGFIAPEFNSKTNEERDSVTDIYMLGCLYYFIITNGLILPDITHKKKQSKVFGALHSYQAKQKSSDVVLCLDVTIQMLWFKKTKRTSIEMILEHPFFWTSEKLLNFIIEVAVRIEQRDKIFYSKLEAKRRNIVGNDWTVGLDDIYLEISKGRVYNVSSVVDLVKVFRNQIAHTNSSRVAETIGSSKEELMNYFLEKFPHLIPHLYSTMNA